MTDSGNAAQTRIIAEQVAEAAVVKFAAEHPNTAGNNPMAQITLAVSANLHRWRDNAANQQDGKTMCPPAKALSPCEQG